MMPNLSVLILTVLCMTVMPAKAALEVIGSGFGRSGTDTMRVALNALGYKTDHIKEILENGLTAHMETWHELLKNGCDDEAASKALYEDLGYTAAVDFPTSACWEALMRAYPMAKIVHTQRKSGEDWYASASDSILSLMHTFPFNIFKRIDPFFIRFAKMCDQMWGRIVKRPIEASLDPGFPHAYKDEIIAAYDANNVRVLEMVTPKRLLIHDHKKGWASLCHFLGKPVPDIDYPHTNTRAEFHAFKRNIAMGVAAMLIMAPIVLGLAFKLVFKLFNGQKIKEA
uniref:Sulfotransferase domain-containing protein n=2 Tax=Ditylum brightwellii TaxID=49249 RepID=A0A7S4SFH2_9STRA